MFAKLFGGKNEPKNEISSSEALQKLRENEELLTKKQEHLEKQIEEQLEIAKINGTKNKRASLQALKRKKRLEQQLAQNDGALMTLQNQRQALEDAKANTDIFNVMREAGRALKNTHKDLDIDKVEELVDEIKEQQQIANEISQVISDPRGFGLDADEDELLKELEEIEQEQQARKLIEADVTLPEVPSHSLVEKEKQKPSRSKEDEELEELKQWAS